MKKTSMTFRVVGVMATGLMAFGFLSACRPQSVDKKVAQPPAPVTTATVEIQPMDLTIKAIGAVEPEQSVQIRSQVDGALVRIGFKEGDDVRQGQVLFEIDPRPFEAELKRMEAVLARDRAQLTNAELQVKRNKDLVQKGYITQSQYDELVTGVDSLNATLRADEQAVINAKLQLEHATICAPFAGRTGSLLVHEGDIIRANNADPLVVLNQIRPILVRFTVPSERLADIRRYDGEGTNLEVRVRIPGNETSPQPVGELCFVDNAVDPATGTLALKARFANEHNTLWPGQFVDVTLRLTTEANALVVPSQAVQSGQDGTFVFIVQPDLSVVKKTVTVRRNADGKSVIGEGVKAGDVVVTDGQIRLVPGAKVEIRSGPKTGGEKK